MRSARLAAVLAVLAFVPAALASDFGRPAEIPLGKTPVRLALGDASQDGILDVVTANQAVPNVSVLPGQGDGSFGRRVDYSAGPAGTPARSVAFGDFDSDGAADLAVAAVEGITIFGATDRGLTQRGRYGARAPDFLATGDLNGDGALDLVATSSSGAVLSVLLGRGDGSFDAAVEYPVAAQSRSVVVADLDGDDIPDLAAATGSDLSVLIGAGDGTFGPYRDLSGPVTGLRSVAAGDVDSDGDVDLAVAGGRNEIGILINDGEGSFGPWAVYGAGTTPDSLSLVDVDGDAELDVISANRESNDFSLLPGRGDGTFGPQIRRPVGRTPTSIAAEDVNGDGKTDVVVSNQGARSVTVMLNGADAPQPVICLVPRVTGRKLAVAQRLLTRARCTTGSLRRRYSGRIKKGRVIAQSPAAGTRLPEGARVTLLVSRGPSR